MAEDRTLGQLVSDASQDLSELVKYEMALAKAEIRDDVKHGAIGGGMFGAAGYFAFLASILLVIAAALGLAEAVPGWLAFLIVAIVLLLVAGILALVGRGQFKKIKPPERAIRSAKQTIAAIRGQRSDGAVDRADGATAVRR